MAAKISGTGKRAWAGRRVAVLGLSRSGLAATRLLLAEGAEVIALDLEVKPPYRERFAELISGKKVHLVEGPHPLSLAESVDAVVKSPGVAPEIPFLRLAREKGRPILGEVELGSQLAPQTVVAVTGSNGKSTTVAWLAHVLRQGGRGAAAVGNIGRPLCDAVLEEPTDSILVAEVSSFQLEDSPHLRPYVAVLLNLTPDHLDRHGDFTSYARIKWGVARNQGPGDFTVLGPELDADAGARLLGKESLGGKLLHFGREDRGTEGAFVRRGWLWRRWSGWRRRRGGGGEEKVLEAGRLPLRGPHNLANALAVIAAALPFELKSEDLAAGLADFGGLPHRMESVGVVRGVTCVNDSKATNVASLEVALQSFPAGGGVVLIAGGRDKGGDFERLTPVVHRSVRTLVLIGEAAGRLRRAWADVPAVAASSLEDAVEKGLDAAASIPNREGRVLLLSPGCASFDMFRDYEDRGDQFRQIVRAKMSRERGASGRDESRTGGSEGKEPEGEESGGRRKDQ